MTFCAPKSVSVLWGLSDDDRVRAAVDAAHDKAVAAALRYLELHAGYTCRADPANPKEMIIEDLCGLSGVRYEHRTSRAGDPHVHSHVLVNNKQRSLDGKFRTIDGVSLYHEARAAGMLYQAQLRAEISASLGVQWGEVRNGCAEIVGLDDAGMLDAFSTRRREIDAWREANSTERTADRCHTSKNAWQGAGDHGSHATTVGVTRGVDAGALDVVGAVDLVDDLLDELESSPPRTTAYGAPSQPWLMDSG